MAGLMPGQNASFGSAGLEGDAGKEREETQLVRRRWGGPKVGASLASCHHPPRHSTCRAPRPPTFTRTGGSSLAERPFPSRFAASSTSHELPAAPAGLRRGGQRQVGQGELAPELPCHPVLPGQGHSSLPLYFWVNFFPFFSPFLSQLPRSMLQAAPAGRVQAGVPQGGVFTPQLGAASRQDPKMHQIKHPETQRAP